MPNRPVLDKITVSRLEDLARDVVADVRRVVGWSALSRIQGLEILITSLQWRLVMAKNEFRTETGHDYEEPNS